MFSIRVISNTIIINNKVACSCILPPTFKPNMKLIIISIFGHRDIKPPLKKDDNIITMPIFFSSRWGAGN